MEDTLLASHLVDWGLLSQTEVHEAVELQKRLTRKGRPATLEDVLVDQGFLTRSQLDEAISAIELPPPDDELPAEVVEALRTPANKFGHFVRLGEVGRGGLGVVHRAWDLETRRIVALKFLKAEANLDAERVMELLMEGSRLSRLRHPNIITVHEFGQISDQFYVAMELLEGMGLDQLMRAARTRNQFSPFYNDPKKYLKILRDIARALHYMHTRKPAIVHCDLKPHNICVDLSWRPFLVDFGLARELRGGAPSDKAGTIKGSPSYMSPEQAMGQEDKIDQRTDVYGLGAILYELLTGRPPFTGEMQNVIDQSALVDPPKPSEVVAQRNAISSGTGLQPTVPPEVEAICLRAIAKEQKDRFPSAAALASAIDPLVGDKPLRVKMATVALKAPAPGTERSQASITRRKPVKRAMRASLLVGFLGGVVAVVALGLVFLNRGPEAVVENPLIQEEARIRKKMDEFAAKLEIERAEIGYRTWEGVEPSTERSAWVSDQVRELGWIRDFRNQLGETLSRERPKIPSLKLRTGAFREVMVTVGSQSGITVASGDEGTVEVIAWAEIHPESIVDIARKFPDEFRHNALFGLALYEIKNQMTAEAKRILEKMDTVDAKRVLAGLAQESH